MPIQNIGDFIEGRSLVTITRGASVMQACKMMADHNLRALVVMDEIGMCGILSERDVIRRCDAQGAPSELMRVDTIMTPAPKSVEKRVPLGEAIAVMQQGGFRHLPVTDDAGKVVGITSMRDIQDRCHPIGGTTLSTSDQMAAI